MILNKPLSDIKGVGDKTAEIFQRAGLYTVDDILNFFPRTYEDYTVVSSIADIKPGKVTLRVRIESIKTKRVRRGMHITEATLCDVSGKVAAIWFNQPYRADQLRKEKTEWLISGEFSLQGQKYQLQNPSVEKSSSEHINSGRLLPIYPAVAGIKSHLVRKIISELRPLMTMLDETLPLATVRSEKLINRSQSFISLHFPESMQDIEKAKERMGFEELFSLMLAADMNKKLNQKVEGYTIAFNEEHARAFTQKLPFKLTDGQRKAIWQIVTDFSSSIPMNRLLQGDVGSGKTVVAAMAASLASQQGYQSAVLAPTEILAAQHAETLTSLVSPFGISVGLLTGSVKGKARTLLYDAIKQGEVDIIVGTHALLQSKVHYAKLGFVVIDEQHRFGVKQRQQLLEKSEKMPHVLSMTATPIPRSLALTVYGELDVTILNERPKHRQAIQTEIISPNSREQMYTKVKEELEKGRQIYVVCPLIDYAPENEKRSVEEEFHKLQKTIFSKWRIGLLHGQLSSEQKQEVMTKFNSHETDILVSTTVVEVGVDVPNATVMIIENADQFGLAQAHQLRGRVGRGAHQSYCFLVSSDSMKPTRRMRELARSNDGFYLAEIDLQLRGPGEIYGRAQHGQLNLKMAKLSDTAQTSRVQKAVQAFIKRGENLLQYKQLYKTVQKYQRITTLN